MKRSLLFLLASLIPLILAANPLTFSNLFRNSIGQGTLNPNRAWRLMEQTTSDMGNQGWEESSKVVYYYNTTHPSQVDSLKMLSFDPDLPGWVELMYVINTYQPGGGNLVASVASMVLMGMRLPFMRVEASYDNQQRLAHLYLYSQPLFARVWTIESRQHYIYGGTNHLTVYAWYAPDDTGTPPYSKSSFTWNTQGQLSSFLTQESPDSTATSWVNESKGTFTWHPNDSTDYNDVIAWLTDNMPNMMIAFTYDPGFGMFGGMPTEVYDEDWNGTWVPSYRTNYSYNANNTLNYSYSADYSNSAWTNSGRYDYVYGANNNLSTMYMSEWDFDWVQTGMTTYNWQSFTGVEDENVPGTPALALSLYPVPFRSEVNISVGGKSLSPVDIDIYNLKGQLVHQSSVAPNSVYVWNTKSPAGLYLIRATQNGESTIRKAIKLK